MWHSPRMSLKVLKSLILSKQLSNLELCRILLPEVTSSALLKSSDELGSFETINVEDLVQLIIKLKNINNNPDNVLNLKKCLQDFNSANLALKIVHTVSKEELTTSEQQRLLRTFKRQYSVGSGTKTDETLQILTGFTALEGSCLVFLMSQLQNKRTTSKTVDSILVLSISKACTNLSLRLMSQRRLEILFYPSNKVLLRQTEALRRYDSGFSAMLETIFKKKKAKKDKDEGLEPKEGNLEKNTLLRFQTVSSSFAIFLISCYQETDSQESENPILWLDAEVQKLEEQFNCGFAESLTISL